MNKIIATLLILLVTISGFSQELNPFYDKDGRFGFKTEEGSLIVAPKFDSYNDGYIEYKVGKNNEVSFIILGKDAKIIQGVKKIVQVEDIYEGFTTSFIINESFAKEGEFYIINNNGVSKPYTNIRVLQNASDEMDFQEKYFYKPIIEKGLYNLFPNVDSLDYYSNNMERINGELEFKYIPYVSYSQLPKELLFIVKENDKWGVVNSKFEIVLESKYDKVDILQNGKVWHEQAIS